MQSDDIKDLAGALAKAQGEIKNASLNKVNPHFRSKYADLAEVRDATTPHLSKNGLAILQRTDVRDGMFGLVTCLMHSSGQWVDGFYPLPNNVEKPQALGSAITYARRYSWSAMCGIAADEDDDGNEAQKQAPAPNSPPKQQQSLADFMVAEIGKFATVESLNGWVKTQTAAYGRLSKIDQERVHRATEAKRADLARPLDDAPFDTLMASEAAE